jgi:hypothetical protein
MYHLHFRPVELYLKRLASESRNYREQIEAVEDDQSWRSVSAVPFLFGLLLTRAGYHYNRALEQQKSRGLSKLARRSCHRCTHICRRVLSICSVRRRRNADWDGCRLCPYGYCISLIRHVAIPRPRSSQCDRYSPWKYGLIFYWGCRLPLLEEVPLTFKTLPEYFVEDLVEYWAFLLQCVVRNTYPITGIEWVSSYTPPVMMAQGSNELVDFSMAFLTSTWYITNPYLKSKLITVRPAYLTQLWLLMTYLPAQALAAGVRKSRGGRPGVLIGILSSHPLALKHLMTSLMQFYVGVYPNCMALQPTS